MPETSENDWLGRIGLTLICITLCSCGGRPGRIATPSVDAKDAAQAALKLYDRDSDGLLDSEELKASPPLLDAQQAYESDGDGSLSEPELTAGIQSWASRRIGAKSLPITVELDGRPLPDAEVKLIPAPFLNDAVPAVSSVTDSTGAGSLQVTAENRPSNFLKKLPVMQPGLYLVEITHPTIPIPAIYYTATTLGLEAGVAGQNPAGITWKLHLKKK